LNKKKIYGCEKGSRAWHHEYAHILFDDSEYGTRIKYYHYFFTMLVVILIPFTLFVNHILLKVFLMLNSLGILITYLIEEIWCETYARKEIKKKSNTYN